MANVVFDAFSPDGETREIHFDSEPTPSELVDALNRQFQDADFAGSEVTGREDRFEVDLREGGTFTVARKDS